MAWTPNWDAAGGILSIGSTVTGMIGSMAAADTARYQAKSKGLALQHQEDMAKVNAGMLEMEAQQIFRAYDRQIQIKGIKAGLEKGTARASFSARGIQMGVGSTANAFASAAVMREIDKITMNSNRIRAANQMRTRGVQSDIRADMLGVSASNMFATASAVSPFLNMTNTLMAGAADFAKNEGYGFFEG
tara:strand:- start:1091 stop:1657 length:567 start_codon:yes stop_codon:yes gene_type:complete